MQSPWTSLEGKCSHSRTGSFSLLRDRHIHSAVCFRSQRQSHGRKYDISCLGLYIGRSTSIFELVSLDLVWVNGFVRRGRSRGEERFMWPSLALLLAQILQSVCFRVSTAKLAVLIMTVEYIGLSRCRSAPGALPTTYRNPPLVLIVQNETCTTHRPLCFQLAMFYPLGYT